MQIVSANGAKIPALGFGTYGMARGDMLRMIPEALKAGFRHIDTAQIYRNEAEVGECVEASGIARENLFLTTKVWVANYPANAFSVSVAEFGCFAYTCKRDEWSSCGGETTSPDGIQRS